MSDVLYSSGGYRDEDVTEAVDFELYRARDLRSWERPKAILLAGQPGAGKSVLSKVVMMTRAKDFLLINGDEYRRYHPLFTRYHEEAGADFVPLTAAFSGAVTERLIDRASDLHLNLMIEGTGRTVEVPRKTAVLLSAKGYQCELAVMAVHPVLSLIGTLRRFYEMRDRGTVPRATAVEAHDRVVAVLPDNLDILRLDTSISRITLWNRDGQRLYDSAVDPGLPSEALRRQWNRPWSRKELQAVQRQISELRQKEEATSSGQAEAIRELERRAKRVPLRNRSRDR